MRRDYDQIKNRYYYYYQNETPNINELDFLRNLSS